MVVARYTGSARISYLLLQCYMLQKKKNIYLIIFDEDIEAVGAERPRLQILPFLIDPCSMQMGAGEITKKGDLVRLTLF